MSPDFTARSTPKAGKLLDRSACAPYVSHGVFQELPRPRRCSREPRFLSSIATFRLGRGPPQRTIGSRARCVRTASAERACRRSRSEISSPARRCPGSAACVIAARASSPCSVRRKSGERALSGFGELSTSPSAARRLATRWTHWRVAGEDTEHSPTRLRLAERARERVTVAGSSSSFPKWAWDQSAGDRDV